MFALVALGSEQRFDLGIRLRGLQDLVEVLGPAGEALLVFRLAAETGDGQVKRFGAQRGNAESAQSRMNTITADSCSFVSFVQITPHFRRSSHSADRSISSSRKITGMSHRSRVSRTVIPASE